MAENELLARIDERVGSIKEDISEIKSELKELHGIAAINHGNIIRLVSNNNWHTRWLTGITTFIVGIVSVLIYTFFKKGG